MVRTATRIEREVGQYVCMLDSELLPELRKYHRSQIDFFFKSKMKLLIVALIRNEAAHLLFLGVSLASEGRGFSDANMNFQYVC